MPTFTVSLVLKDVELTNDVVDAVFAKLPDSVPSLVNGLVKITSPVEAVDAEAAAFQLIDEVQALLPSAVPARLDQDLVSISDIAARTNRSRESVRLLVDGKRGPGGFPAPVGTVGDGIRVWPWAVVLDWFANELGEDLGEMGVAPDVAAVVDACLAGKRRHALAHTRRVSWRTSTAAVDVMKVHLVAALLEARNAGEPGPVGMARGRTSPQARIALPA